METIGRLIGATRTLDGSGIHVTFEVDASAANQIEQMNAEDRLRIKAVKYRRKRSLDANAYFHVLVGKIADVLTISKARCKNILICRYGQMELIDGEPIVYKTNAPPEYMDEQEYIHAFHICTKEEDGKEIHFYRIFRGSHTYDSREMSVLIDGTVQEAKDMGIETLTPRELEKMKEAWK